MESTYTVHPGHVAALDKLLFTRAGLAPFAVLDGASIPKLRQALWKHEPEHACLYAGTLEPDMQEVAPYLVRLVPDTAFTQWVIREGWGQHWGIFALSRAPLREVRRHLRTFLMVRDPDDRPLYFRYYDPRVLDVYLPTCTPEELEAVFGNIETFLLETAEGAKLASFTRRESQLHSQELDLASVSGGDTTPDQ